MHLKKIKVNSDIHESDIKKFQCDNNLTLPSEYIFFLLQNINISIDSSLFETGQYEYSGLSEIIMFGEIYDFQKMVQEYHKYDYFQNNRIDLYDNCVLIGEESNNGYFFIQMFDDQSYKIGFWDHDYLFSEYLDETEDELINERMNPHNTYYLTDSFAEFFEIWEFKEYRD